MAVDIIARGMAGQALDAASAVESIGRYLTTWNCATGKPVTDPATLPYTYKPGDYYRVSVLAVGDGAVNYRPDGTTYTGAASTVAETEVMAINDLYLFDGTVWTPLHLGTHDTVRLEFVYDDGTSAEYDFTATEVTTPDGDEGGDAE